MVPQGPAFVAALRDPWVSVVTPRVLTLGHVQPSVLSPSCLGCTCLVRGSLEGATTYKACCSQGRVGQTLQGPEYNLTRGRGVAEQATYQTPSQWAGMSTSPSGKNGCQGREDGANTLS